MITRRCACAVVLEKSATTPGRTSNVKTNDPNLRKYLPFMIYPPCSLYSLDARSTPRVEGEHKQIMPIRLRSPYKKTATRRPRLSCCLTEKGDKINWIDRTSAASFSKS